MERLDKVLAGTGRWSRREVKDLVRQGRVRIDGVTARTAEEKLDPDAAAGTDQRGILRRWVGLWVPVLRTDPGPGRGQRHAAV